PEGQVRPARWAVMVLGGPLSNLLIGVACLAAASWHNPGPPDTMPRAARTGWRSVALAYPGDPTTALLNIAGLSNLGLGLAVLLPGRGAGPRADGGQLRDLWRRGGGPAARRGGGGGPAAKKGPGGGGVRPPPPQNATLDCCKTEQFRHWGKLRRTGAVGAVEIIIG